MLPFNQNMQNQHSPATPRGPTPHHQQVNGAQSNMFPNNMQLQPQLGFMNPQVSNNNGFNLNMGNGNRPPGMMNMPNFNAMQQNPVFPPGFGPQNFGQNPGFMGNGQVGNMGQNMIQGNMNTGFMGNGQNMNQVGGVMLNPAQIAALSQLMGCVNQVAQGIIAPNGVFGNSQPGLVQPNGGLQQQGNFGMQLPLGSQQLPLGSQQLQNVPPMPFSPPLAQNSQPRNLQNQGNHGIKQGTHNSNGRHNQNKNNTKNPRREASNWRSPNSKTPPMNNGFNGITENSPNQTKNEKRKPLFLHYTDKEIQKWREERKKNYPTKDNFHKKLSQKQANADAAAEDAKLRREQLKEILAKQAELGLEVPEIPSHYLLDNEDFSNGNDGNNKRQFNNGRRQNKFNKRGRFDKSNRFQKRKFKDNNFEENDEFPTNPMHDNRNYQKTPIREPSLLQKLLSPDIKRDKNRLLQACHFMVINSFFSDKTDEPLKFPKVIVEEIKDDINEESSLKDGLNSIVEVPVSCQEEGEITD